MVNLKNGKCTMPVIALLSGKWNDAEPFITMDGKKLFFISTRPVKASDTTEKDLGIWYVKRKEKLWGEPVRLGTLIDSPNNEWYPTVARSGNLYLCSERE